VAELSAFVPPREFAHFAMITRSAGAYQIFPAMGTTAMARQHMVKREISTAPITILAGVVIATENFTARKLNIGQGTTNHMAQSDDRRTSNGVVGRVQHGVVVFQHFGFTTQHKHQGTTCRADIEWLVIMVEDEYGRVHRDQTPSTWKMRCSCPWYCIIAPTPWQRFSAKTNLTMELRRPSE